MSKIKSPYAKASEDKSQDVETTKDESNQVEAKTTDNLESKPSVAEATEDKYLRALADYQNLSRQHLKDKQEFAKYANEGLLQDFIPVYDYLKISLAHAEEGNKWLEGIKHILSQFKKVLENNGVAEIMTQGVVFDHATMEAVSNEETNNETKDGLVAKELKAGYSLNGKVIIPARVVVYKIKN